MPVDPPRNRRDWPPPPPTQLFIAIIAAMFLVLAVQALLDSLM